MLDKELQSNIHENKINNNEAAPVLKKKPVVKVLMEKKEVIYASEAAGYCSDQC